MGMLFRKGRGDDLGRIMDVLADGRRSLGALGIDQWQGGYPRRDVVEEDLAQGRSYVVEADGRVVATAMLGLEGEADYDRIEGGWLTAGSSDRPCYAVLHRLAVSSDAKNKGAASFLLTKAEQLAGAEGRASLRIDTHPGNLPMQKLLEKRGYLCCGTIRIGHADELTPERRAYEKLV